ncbi:Methionine synthase reductase MTRR [Gracilaria domingensis]|nr:Methionine synthase reductase MTRR [Gracilaria domingensis]
MSLNTPLVNVLYGTVTGNAEEIARRIHTQLPSTSAQQGLLRCLSDYADVPAFTKPAAHPHTYNIIVVSTTGDGDPPETIRPFMRLLRKKDPKKLEGLRYGVLALGDTNYENFCNTGKRIDNAMTKLGAERFLKRGEADDGVGLEVVVEPWLKNMWSTLEEISVQLREAPSDISLVSEETNSLPIEEEASSVQADELETLITKISIEELGFDESKLPKMFPPKVVVDVLDDSSSHQPPLSVNPSYLSDVVRCASVTDAKLLTSPDCEKTVWHMEVTCNSGNQMKRKYRPGDAFGVIVENHPAEVDRFLKVLCLDGNQLLRLSKENGVEVATATVLQFVKQRIDLRAIPKKSLIRAMSDHCHDTEERKALLHLCSRDGRRKYTEQVTKSELSILRLIEEMATSCRAPLSLFLDQVPSVAPRWYSATSSPELDGEDVLQFAFSVVKSGLATTALSGFCARYIEKNESSQILLIPRESDNASHFRPPASLQTSYIMIGPGTGVAPFRGFLRERLYEMQHTEEDNFGTTILFSGCRHQGKDFLYEQDLYSLKEKAALTKLDVAFSRDGPKKVYVQDRLRAEGKEVAEVIKNGGSIYVCGDGGGMAQGVHLALSEILSEFCCDGNAEDGKSMLRQLAEEYRYVRDIWFYG